MKTEIEKRHRDKIKKIGPNECGIVYDNKRGIVLGICNKNGKLRFIKKALEEI